MNEDICVKCIICQRGALAPLADMATIFAAGIFPKKGRDRDAVVAALERAEEAAKAARACLLSCLGL